ncbi:hypothetical protein V2H45_21265 [Tumidithrix elongata RA019]|uniref:Uncharacterized protein n=1 Tax=Tumidithrix elongata BACA0141 TaxID=2716417 RepID=A0AAW9PXN1_9CYAN|nr:hypothetical protein [Tumidithrix elongata RA019]
MITTIDILQAIPKLPQEDCFRIAETLLQTLQAQTAIPTREQINQQLQIAALLAVEDYINDPELTAFTALDGEDFYEYA